MSQSSSYHEDGVCTSIWFRTTSKRSKLFQFMGNTPIARTAPTDNVNAVNGKVEAYLDSPCLPEDTDPLEYWKSQQSQQPQLANLACQYLSIPISSGPVEQLFSIAGKSVQAREMLSRRYTIREVHVHRV